MKLFRLGVVLGLVLSAGVASSAPVGAGEPGALGVVVTLAEDEASVLPGGAFPVFVRFEMPPGVHLYWLNAGEAGMPPRVDAEAPAGWETDREDDGFLLMPPPIRFEAGGIVGFGYEHELLVEGGGAVTENVPVGSRGEASVRVRYLACDADRCVPGEARLTLPLVKPEGYVYPHELSAEITGGLDAHPEQEVVVAGGFLPLPGIPEGATDVGYFPLPKAFLAGIAGADEARAETGVPVVEREDASGWRVAVGDLLDGAADDSVATTGGLVAFDLDGRREGFLVIGRSR